MFRPESATAALLLLLLLTLSWIKASELSGCRELARATVSEEGAADTADADSSGLLIGCVDLQANRLCDYVSINRTIVHHLNGSIY